MEIGVLRGVRFMCQDHFFESFFSIFTSNQESNFKETGAIAKKLEIEPP